MSRRRTALAAVLYVLVVGALLVAATRWDRYPAPEVLVALAVFAPPFAAGLLGQVWRLLLLVPVPVALGVALASAADNPFNPLVAGLIAAFATLLVLPLGVAVGRRAEHPRLAAYATALFVAALAVVPVAIVERRRTVTVDRDSPLPLDERAGTFRGVGLGDPAGEVRRRLGRGERIGPSDPRRRGVGPNVTTGPSSLPAASGEELRYGRDVSFHLGGGRVELVEIANRRARTRAGVGPGDSLSRFRDAYPGMRCDEGSIGSDAPNPYPECEVQVGERRWLYVSGTYDLAGEPAVVLILATGRIGPG